MLRLGVLAATLASAAATWSIITTASVGTQIEGLGFADANTGYVSGSDGFGQTAHQTTDGGKTWNPIGVANLYIFQIGGAAAYGSSAVIPGTNGIYFSVGGGNFSASLSGSAAGGLQIRKVNPTSPAGQAIFGPTQDGKNGVSVSTDDGLTFTEFDATSAFNTSASTVTPTVVTGAAPSATTWFAAGIIAPAGLEDDGEGWDVAADGENVMSVRQVTHTFRFVYYNDGTAAASRKTVSGAALERLEAKQGSQYVATTDGGSTFSLQQRTPGAAAEGVDCISATQCVVVASGANYGFIYTTLDGGNTWTQSQNGSVAGTVGQGEIILDVRATGPSSYIAVGGNAQQQSAVFYNSADAGKTWTVDTTSITDLYVATGIDCVPGTAQCWATLVDTNGDSQIASNQ